jgi:hypothetical protein
MDHKYIDQFDIIDQYLMRRLTEEESASFEEHFLDCPRCMDRLKTTRNYIQVLQAISVEQVSQKSDSKLRALHNFFQLSFGKPLAWAGVFLLLVIILSLVIGIRLVRQYRSEIAELKKASSQLAELYEEARQAASLSDKERQDKEQELTEQIRELEARLQNEQNPGTNSVAGAGNWRQPRINLSVFVLNPVRGSEQNPPESVNEIKLPRAPVDFIISLPLVGETRYNDYRVAILNAHKQPVWKRRGLKPDRYNSLPIGFNSRFFQPGDYLFVVDGITKEGSHILISNYPFRIIKTP